MILHICAAGDWARVPVDGRYSAPSLADVGFIHCADRGTVALSATSLYRGRTDLVLLGIEPTWLDVPVRWEQGEPPHPAGIWFPHVYGSIRSAAVTAVHDFPPEQDGSFRLPSALAGF